MLKNLDYKFNFHRFSKKLVKKGKQNESLYKYFTNHTNLHIKFEL